MDNKTREDMILKEIKEIKDEVKERFNVIDGKLKDQDGSFGRIESAVLKNSGGIEVIDNKIKVIDNKIKGIDNKIKGIDNKIKGIDNKIRGIDNKIEVIDNKLEVHDSRFDRIESAVLENNRGIKEIKKNLHTAITNHEQRIRKLEHKVGV